MECKTIDKTVLHQTLTHTRQTLLDGRNEENIWPGRLSSSPLATAVAVFALYQVDRERYQSFIESGLRWLAASQQADGSWGDAEQLDSGNLSTTLLCYAAFCGINRQSFEAVIKNAENRICTHAGGMQPEQICEAVYRVYGKDRTFAIPILTMCALAGVQGTNGWRFIKPLPFELAALPRGLFRWLKLNVVSYALPALIAMGQVKFHFDRPANPIARLLRMYFKGPTLQRLETIQPVNGGFLEATPLTSFVVMSLAAMGLKEHPVVLKGVEFITRSMRSNGSWPIDTNLSTWLTNLSVSALLQPGCEQTLWPSEKKTICDWYLAQQFRCIHPYTGASPGGWGWTNLPGSVPDADDTAGALVALHTLGVRDENVMDAVRAGIEWLLKLQNSDGGVPTFCRGWGRLDFDRSCPDITAHAITAWYLWHDEILDLKLQKKMKRAVRRALIYLSAGQCSDGSWLPLWFGNPSSPQKTNPVYGTAKVLCALGLLNDSPQCRQMSEKGIAFLLAVQNDDAGWGSKKGAVSTIEETALAINALMGFETPAVKETVDRGLLWLIEHTRQGTYFPTAPIGLYFAKLWYAERLYPIIFSLQAIQRVS
ncbi:MAG: squalene--hopene cyclase [Phycisphaerae bacterium]|nr:squalene--hopene cyclase [Phycisphaerae bacterium]